MAEVPSGIELLNVVREAEGLPPLDLDPNNPEDIAALQEEWRRQNANASTMSRLDFIRKISKGKQPMPEKKPEPLTAEDRDKRLLEALVKLAAMNPGGAVGIDPQVLGQGRSGVLPSEGMQNFLNLFGRGAAQGPQGLLDILGGENPQGAVSQLGAANIDPELQGQELINRITAILTGQTGTALPGS